MGRGPGLLSEIGFQVTAVSDGGGGQQAVKILRNDTEVSSTETSTTLGTFNQDTLVPPVASSNGNIVLVSGTDTETPIIGGADPVGSGTFQKRHKVVPLTTLSNQDTNKGYMTSASAGSNAGDIAHSIASKPDGKPLLAHQYVYTTDVTGSAAGTFEDNGNSSTIGTAPGAVDDVDTIGFGTWDGQTDPTWLKLEVRAGVSVWYDSANTVRTGSTPSFSPAADILVVTSQDTMMTSTYALNNADPVIYDLGSSYPVVTDTSKGVFSSQGPAVNGDQISYEDQTIGTGSGNGYLYTGNLYDYASKTLALNEFVKPPYDWTAIAAGTKVNGDQDFGYKTDRLFSGYGYSTNLKISGPNNFAVESSLPSAQGSVVYLTNGNKDIGWGLMGITYSIGAEVITIPTGATDATFRYATSFTTGTFSVSTTTDNTTKCQDLPTVIEGDGSVNLNLCAGTKSKSELSGSFAF